MSKTTRTPPPAGPKAPKALLHPRNVHGDGYDFAALTASFPALQAFVIHTIQGKLSINFADPRAVKALNAALLKHHYQIAHWDIPDGFLCPPIPGRIDYLHYLADLFATTTLRNHNTKTTTILDIGTGANLIYPLLGNAVYRWSFVGVDINENALTAAQQLISANNVAAQITLRQQSDARAIFDGVIKREDYFAATICNPPFHRSAQAAAQGTQRKWRNLGREKFAATTPRLNFGGQENELYCEGGEATFLHRMVVESQRYAQQVGWFTTLVSNADLLPSLRRALARFADARYTTITMRQGQKTSRILAWTFGAESAQPHSS